MSLRSGAGATATVVRALGAVIWLALGGWFGWAPRRPRHRPARPDRGTIRRPRYHRCPAAGVPGDSRGGRAGTNRGGRPLPGGGDNRSPPDRPQPGGARLPNLVHKPNSQRLPARHPRICVLRQQRHRHLRGRSNRLFGNPTRKPMGAKQMTAGRKRRALGGQSDRRDWVVAVRTLFPLKGPPPLTFVLSALSLFLAGRSA